MVFRIYAEKKPGLDHEAASLLSELRAFLKMESLTGLRVLNRYDVEGIEESLFETAVHTVFSEPQLDDVYEHIPEHDGYCFAVEYLPGQFDQRADSAATCIQLISQVERPTVRTAKIYILTGSLTEEDVAVVKKYVINPVESREAALDRFETLEMRYDLPETVPTLTGFLSIDEDNAVEWIRKYGLAMDAQDLCFCRNYFAEEGREPTLTELRMIDTYWSDHCRHTTFLTTLDEVRFEDAEIQAAYESYLASREDIGRTKPINLMDIATMAGRWMGKKGLLPGLDESEEINACTVKIKVKNDKGEEEDWLLLFKNETHNHPTEIEPFGGAATCIGGAIRDPLSGRSYVYGAMRVTGAANPLRPVEETLAGKLPQRKLVTTAAAGYSSYGNQIGLATGIVDEIYHDGYAAKHMEIGAVIAAAPQENVRREVPAPGDVVILLGGRTGRDGIGGATGSSKSHTMESLETCGAEVQKGNAPEERKLQRLFRDKTASQLIKRCNDFGAGGVSVAIGELADGLKINLNAVPKKYEGLDGTELAISESQERMAVVVEAKDADAFMECARKENLEATIVAVVTEEPRLVMHWNGKTIVDVSREFLNSNGAEKHMEVDVPKANTFDKAIPANWKDGFMALTQDINLCSRRGLSERFDSTIGAGTVLMPFGGKYQQTPIQAMVHLIARETGHTSTVSLMSWGYNPEITSLSPFHGAYLAVVESVSKLIATGASFDEVYLTFQEYFEKPLRDSRRWGKPLAALLGAFRAQMDLGVAAIGGKDSMSGSFEDIDVPPTLVSFAVTKDEVENIISNDAKKAGTKLVWLRPEYDAYGVPTIESLKTLYARVTELMRAGLVYSAFTPVLGGVADAVAKMALGNGLGFDFCPKMTLAEIFGYAYGSFLLEMDETVEDGKVVGTFTDKGEFTYAGETVKLSAWQEAYEATLEPVYPVKTSHKVEEVPAISYTNRSSAKASVQIARPRVLIPVFPGTNCEVDTARAVADAGAIPEIFVINNLSASAIAESVHAFAAKIAESQIVFVPGGFSGGDEPDGSGKFITAFFRNGEIKEEITRLLEVRDGLMGGICNGFQALVKLGLVPFGKIIETDDSCPTLTFNTIGRHQSRLVRTRVASNKSPWLMETEVDDIITVPISHGEGRFMANEETVRRLIENGQIMTQYADMEGKPSMDVAFNPNQSVYAIEGILSPDGRVFGKMGHSERIGEGLYRNVEGRYEMGLFRSAVKYFK